MFVLLFAVVATFVPMKAHAVSVGEWVCVEKEDVYLYSYDDFINADGRLTALFALPQGAALRVVHIERDKTYASVELYLTEEIFVRGYIRLADFSTSVMEKPDPAYPLEEITIQPSTGTENHCVYKTPQKSVNVDDIYMTGERTFYYLGNMTGVPYVAEDTNIWYAVAVIPNDGSQSTKGCSVGYVYHTYTDKPYELPQPEPEPEPDPESDPKPNTPDKKDKTSAIQVALVMAICIPAVILIYLIFRPSRRIPHDIDDL